MPREEPSDQHAVAAVREEARRLAGELPGALRRIEVRSGDVAVEIEWQDVPQAPVERNGHAPAGVVAAPASAAPGSEDAAVEQAEEQHLVVSPMVGTFYHAPEPGADPFVKVGDLIQPGQVVGIVEAMKLMNPISADIEGAVAAVLVADAEPVEFGQPLIALMPA